jgi:hypothetical protein
MIFNLIVGIHDVYLSSDRRLLNTISYVHSYGGDNLLCGGYIFTIMDNTYIALKKILNIMVPEKYPMVSDIKVIDDSYEYDNSTNYLIYLGVTPDELETLRNSDVRDYIEDVSRYVLKGNETLRIVFYNPDLW